MCTRVYMYVRVCVGMEQGGTLQGLLPPVSVGGVACEADSLSWRETGQLSGELGWTVGKWSGGWHGRL